MEPHASPYSEGFPNISSTGMDPTIHPYQISNSSAPSSPRYNPHSKSTPHLRPQSRLGKPYSPPQPSRTNTKEAKRRQDIAIRVVTQPSNRPQWASIAEPLLLMPLPDTWTELLMRLYEAVIQAKNCEIPTQRFWGQYDCSEEAFARLPYTREGIEHTLSTIGVECSTQSHGKQVTTGRWLLLRHGHFLLRSQHTITWVETSPPQSTETPVVWDWRSEAEKWRWHTWKESMFMRYTPDGQFEEVQPAEQDIEL